MDTRLGLYNEAFLVDLELFGCGCVVWPSDCHLGEEVLCGCNQHGLAYISRQVATWVRCIDHGDLSRKQPQCRRACESLCENPHSTHHEHHVQGDGIVCNHYRLWLSACHCEALQPSGNTLRKSCRKLDTQVAIGNVIERKFWNSLAPITCGSHGSSSVFGLKVFVPVNLQFAVAPSAPMAAAMYSCTLAH